jgi:hypothetical protein
MRYRRRPVAAASSLRRAVRLRARRRHELAKAPDYARRELSFPPTEEFKPFDTGRKELLDAKATELVRMTGGDVGSGVMSDAAGRKAVEGVMSRYADVPGDWNDLARDSSEAQKANSVKIRKLTTDLQVAIAEQLVPEIMRILPELSRLVPAVGAATREFVTIANAMAENPFTGLGAIMSGYIAAELGKQALADAASLALSKGLSGIFAAGGLAFGSLTASIALAKLIIGTMELEADRKVSDAAKSAGEIREKARQELVETGSLSPATRKELEQLGATEQGAIKKGDAYLDARKNMSTAEKLGDFMSRTGTSLGTFLGVIDEKPGQETLQQSFDLSEVASNRDYRGGAAETQEILQLIKQLGDKGAAEAIKAAATDLKDAARELKSAGPSTPPRGNGPSPTKS